MKSYALLFLRVSTGLLLVLWGFIKVGAPESAIGVSETYYGGILSAEGLQMGLGIAEILLGLAVVLGLFRKVIYPVQAIVLGLGTAAIWKYLLDPLGLYLLTEETRNPLFFPSLCVFAATLVMIAFREDDRLSLDGVIKR